MTDNMRSPKKEKTEIKKKQHKIKTDLIYLLIHINMNAILRTIQYHIVLYKMLAFYATNIKHALFNKANSYFLDVHLLPSGGQSLTHIHILYFNI